MATTVRPTDTTVRYARGADGAAIAYRVLSDGPIDLLFNTGLISHVEVLLEEPGVAPFVRALRTSVGVGGGEEEHVHPLDEGAVPVADDGVLR